MLISGLYQSSGVVLSSDSASVRGWWPLLFFIAAVAWFLVVAAGLAAVSSVEGWFAPDEGKRFASDEGERFAGFGGRVIVAVVAFVVVWFSLDWAFVDSEKPLAASGEGGIGLVLVILFAVASMAGLLVAAWLRR